MYKFDEAHPAVHIGAEPNRDGFRIEPFDPHPSARQNGTSRPGARQRIVPAPGGVAFVEVEPATERI